MKKIFLFIFLTAGIYLFSCSKKTNFQNNIESVRTMLNRFLKPGADTMSLTRELKPDKDDYFAYFKEEVAKRAYENYKKFWDMVEKRNMPIAPKTGQTELILFSATVEELRSKQGESAKFPGGYSDVSIYIKEGQKVYAFKFVAPGETRGMSFDGLVFVNNKWVIFPKPWRALR